MKKTLDAAAAWALFALGAGFFAAFHLQRFPQLVGALSSAAAVAVINVALLNAVRAVRRGDKFLRGAAIAANTLTAAMYLHRLWQFPSNVLHQPVALALAVLLVVELFFAVVG